LVEDNLRLASSKEIAAMKVAAIMNRGSKKDFIDLNELLKIFTLNQILDFYV
jgi:predicted nucleotidyltransferase component of viral defense system